MTGAALRSAGAQVADTLAAAHQGRAPPLDSVVVETPLPGGAGAVARFLLNTVPPWVQIGGVILGIIVAAILAVVLVRRRRAISGWFTAQERGAKVAIAAVVLLLVAGVTAAGAATWNFTQHSNDFCTGCHVMNPAFQKFSAGESGHAKLSCHDCHQQPLSASARQLYLWVAERPAEIGEHAKLDNTVCERCHATADTAKWQRVKTTAGHRVHLESDSSTLENLQCVTCHGAEVHAFTPVAETCGQSECHKPEDTDIVLGKMAQQTMRHCGACHEFTADVPALATRDSAAGTLVPGRPQCLGCHEMREVLADFNEGKDPHGGKCGSCHNPHTQETPAAAKETCATAGCHSNWKDEPFHVGASHRRVGEQCLTCHQPHAAKVDASECQSCHESVRAGGRLRPPVRFDTSAALRRSSTAMHREPTGVERPANAGGVEWLLASVRAEAPRTRRAPPRRGGAFAWSAGADPRRPPDPVATSHPTGPRARFPPPVADGVPPAGAADSFPHARHTRIACLVCHQTGAREGRLTFERPRGCQICHHQAPRDARCETCHQPNEYAGPAPATLTVTVSGHPPRPRSVDFVHAQHAARPCLECHSTPVSLALPPGKAQCTECHVEHHAVGQSCSSCHRVEEPGLAHATLDVAHQRCDACHVRATIEQLTPTRDFCGTCHVPLLANHYEPRECTVCHFLAEPSRHKVRLTTAQTG